MTNSIKFKFTALLMILSLACFAEVRLPKLFGSGMVLQRDQQISIWGWAKPGEKIAVGFKLQQKNTVADQYGKWRVELAGEKNGGPFALSVQGENHLILNDILIGDVWICSGQSNMEFPVAITKDAKVEIETANYPQIRHFNVPKTVSLQPQDNLGAGEWKAVTPGNVGSFTAVGYFFARKLHLELNVPIGIISSNIGGTNIETWISRDGFESDPLFAAMIAKVPKSTIAELNSLGLATLTAQVTQLQGPMATAQEIENWKSATLVDSAWKTMAIPAMWEQRGWPKLDGVVWFRKEVFLNSSDVDKPALLHLGRIDDSDETYINGIQVGRTKALPAGERNYPVPAGLLRPGKNVVAIRIEDTGGGGGFGSTDDRLMLSLGKEQIFLAGAWRYRIAEIFASGLSVYPNSYPTLLFNAMIHPLTSFAIKGVIWYQGESNAFRGYQYRKTFPLLINDWRRHWKQGDFPFLFVQLANFDIGDKNTSRASTWAELRESQSMALSMANTGMAVTIDIGDAKDIHPLNKQDVGKRLAALALRKVYHLNVIDSGPLYSSCRTAGNKMVISFKALQSPLALKEELKVLKGFTIAGEDRKFVDATAYIKGKTVVVYHEDIAHPTAVRYGWEDNPQQANLMNKAGFPASPFRTDSWDLATQGVVYQIGL